METPRLYISMHVCMYYVSNTTGMQEYFCERGIACTCNVSKDTGMGVRKGTVVSFVPTLFGYFLGISSLYVFSFLKCFFL